MSFYSFPFDLTPEGEPQQVQEGRFRKLLRAAVPSGVVLQPGGGPDLRVLRTSDGDAAVSPVSPSWRATAWRSTTSCPWRCR